MQAIAALLNGIPGASFFRSRKSAIARSEGTAIVLEPDPEGEKVEKRTRDLVVRRMTIIVAIVVRGEVPDQLADPFFQAADKALMADQTLGGLASQIIEQGSKWTMDEADLTASVLEIRYELMYQTRASDQSANT